MLSSLSWKGTDQHFLQVSNCHVVGVWVTYARHYFHGWLSLVVFHVYLSLAAQVLGGDVESLIDFRIE